MDYTKPVADDFAGSANVPAPAEAPTMAASRPMEFNPEKYRALLSEFALTQEQETALLLEVYKIMFLCVEAQFTIPTIPDLFAALLAESSEIATDSVQSEDDDE